jgi:hypothetical protein
MIHVFVWAAYSALLALSLMQFRRANLEFASVSFGAAIGTIHFLAAPLFFIMVEGSVVDKGILSNGFNPYSDIFTTLNLFLGWLVVLIAFWFEQHIKFRIPRLLSATEAFNSVSILKCMFLLYLCISVYGGISTGAFSTGIHWHDSSRFNSTSFLILKNFANCFRVLIFGLLLYLFEKGIFSVKKVILLAVFLVLFDVLISFNRITLLYFAVLNMLIFRQRILLLLVLVAMLAPLIVGLSTSWSQFRGIASVEGYSVINFVDSWAVAQSYTTEVESQEPFVTKINGIFESSNIIVFNEIVKRTGTSLDIRYGETFLLRPLTALVPSTIWKNKPDTYGVYLGRNINGIEGLALNSTLFGEAYGNFYYFWPLALLITLIGCSLFFKLFEFGLSGTKAGAIFVGLSLWRFDINFVMVSVYSLILVAMLLSPMRLLRKKWKF